MTAGEATMTPSISNNSVNNTCTSISTQLEYDELSESTWFSIGKLSHEMDEWDRALIAYESALRHNPSSILTLKQLSRLLIERDQFGPATEVLQRLLTLTRGGDEEILSEMALCCLGMEDLGRAGMYVQKAIKWSEEKNVEKKNKIEEEEVEESEESESENNEETATDNEIKIINRSHTVAYSSILWYVVSVYHDRLGNEEAAIDAYLAFIESERRNNSEVTDRTREVYYRLGVLYRLTGKLRESRECFDFVRRQLTCCARPNVQVSGPCQVEVLMQLALVDEAEGEVKRARFALERLLTETSLQGPSSLLYRCRNLVPKLRQRLGCLALSQSTVFENDSSALAQLLKATEEDPQDALNWYFLGRLYLQLRQPTKAYDAYQQAVYRDGRNAAFWNSIGVLYFNIGQFRDALDAFTRAVHHAPQCPQLWWNLGLLYESCNGVNTEDSREAFQKGLDYARSSRNSDFDDALVNKFASKFRVSADMNTSDTTAANNNNNAVANTNNNSIMELDANRFTIRPFMAFPKPQSAASMSRFMTYRSQQQARRSAGGGPSTQPQLQYTANTAGSNVVTHRGFRPPSLMQARPIDAAASVRYKQQP